MIPQDYKKLWMAYILGCLILVDIMLSGKGAVEGDCIDVLDDTDSFPVVCSCVHQCVFTRSCISIIIQHTLFCFASAVF